MKLSRKLSVAPMMDWSDRHCRYLHRVFSQHTLVYTEMVTAPAIIHGDRDHLLGYSDAEHPVALQLGGSDREQLAQAVTIANGYGYDEVNLNIGCPSDRVQSGSFGACLMKEPDLVADCLKAMQDASDVQVTAKCRIGVDDQIPADILPAFIETLQTAGITSVTIHARMAWLDGLSPKQNRDIPPLDYPLVYKMKQDFPDMEIILNGGVKTLAEAQEHLNFVDGVMIGRAAYHTPTDILSSADRLIFGEGQDVSALDAVTQILPYIEAHLTKGGRLNQITRHMLGLFAAQPGAKHYRRYLSEHAHRDGTGPEVLEQAIKAMQDAVPKDD